MNTAKKTILSAAAGLASTRIAQMVSGMDANDFLRPLGLTRRRSSWLPNLALLGAGVVIGGVGALLFAPTSGADTRARIAKRANELSDAASVQVHELSEHVRDGVSAMRHVDENSQVSAQT